MENTQPENPVSQLKKNSNVLIIIVAVIIITILIIVVIILLQRNNSQTTQNTTINTQTTKSNQDTSEENSNTSQTTQEETVLWSFNGSTWSSSGTPPECDEPLELDSPVELSEVTNILYPGQVRGGDFKPHGGFRFDESTDGKISVKAPMAGYVYRGSRYLEQGEIQYMIDIISPCGIMHRFDHLRVLSAKIQALIDTLPEAQPDDSRTHNFTTQVLIAKGEEIASTIGHLTPLNSAFDWGVYDLRAPNSISQNSDWASLHVDEKETAYFAQCWLDLLDEPGKTQVKALPGGGTEGKTSDYCL